MGAPELGLLDTVRMTIGAGLEALSQAAQSQPVWLFAAMLGLWTPLLLGARRANRRHQEAKISTGAAWLSSAIVVAAPLLAVFLIDWLLQLSGAPTLENRVLDYFSPRTILRVPVPAGTILPRLTYPPAATLVLFGSAAICVYTALFVRGGVGVTREGEEAGGWMRLMGHWGNRGPEKRFGLWALPVSKSVFGLAVFSIVGAFAGHISPVLWVVAVLLTHGLMKAAQDALAPRIKEEEEKKAEAQEEEQKPGKAAAGAESAETLEGNVARALDSTPFVAFAQEASPAIPGESEAASSALFREILGGLGIEKLHRHQAAVIEAFLGGANVLLCTPPASGRGALRDSLAMHAVLAEGVSVLFLCKTADEAEAADKAFRERARSAHWRWNVPSMVLSGREQLDLDRVQPSIVFASWDDLHARLLPEPGRFDFFLRSLRMVAIPHLERYVGPAADHLSFLLSRLRQASAQASGVVVAGEGAARQMRLLMVADPVSPDVVRLAERVASGPVTAIGEAEDGSPCVELRHVWLTRHEGSSPSAEEVAAELRRARIPFGAIGLETELGPESAVFKPRKVRAALVRASAARAAQLPLLMRHFGSASGASEVIVFWLGAEDPLSRLLPGAAGKPLLEQLRAPRLVVSTGSRKVACDQACCALAEAEWPLDRLEGVFGAEPAHEALELLRRDGPVVVERKPRLDADNAEVGRQEAARARKSRPHKKVTLGIVGRAVRIEDRTTSKQIGAVSAERALAAGFPERILERGGRRYRMLPIAAQEKREDGVLWAEAEMRPISTVPVRRIELEPAVERRSADRGPANGTERRAPSRRALAGLEFTLAWPRVRIRERIEGFRSIRAGEAIDAGSFPEIIDGAHEGRAAILGFPQAAGWAVTPAGLHALAHLFRVALPAVLQAGPDDLDVADLSWGEELAIAFVDLHPGGGGYAEAITLDAVRTLAKLSLAIVRGCSCRKAGGCPACVRWADCRSASTGGERAPSRKEAERLLCELLDRALLESGDAVKYEDDPAPIARPA
jgi:hypothetical protein